MEKIGKLRKEAARILSENGLPCQPEDIFITRGPKRLMDVCDWQVKGLLCWQTLHEFVENAKAGKKVVTNGSHEFNIACE